MTSSLHQPEPIYGILLLANRTTKCVAWPAVFQHTWYSGSFVKALSEFINENFLVSKRHLNFESRKICVLEIRVPD